MGADSGADAQTPGGRFGADRDEAGRDGPAAVPGVSQWSSRNSSREASRRPGEFRPGGGGGAGARLSAQFRRVPRPRDPATSRGRRSAVGGRLRRPARAARADRAWSLAAVDRARPIARSTHARGFPHASLARRPAFGACPAATALGGTETPGPDRGRDRTETPDRSAGWSDQGMPGW
ncbi:hypothetical protein UK82_03235 [Frankia sp. ACN1ag]|nr:hypothetical protein UK82_03235 [Frankia sp. ACN1ag]